MIFRSSSTRNFDVRSFSVNDTSEPAQRASMLLNKMTSSGSLQIRNRMWLHPRPRGLPMWLRPMPCGFPILFGLFSYCRVKNISSMFKTRAALSTSSVWALKDGSLHDYVSSNK